MCRFTGRAKEIVKIANKPIPTGIKTWIIAEKGYFLHWFWHAKSKDPQGIGPVPKELGANKTAATVVALLKTLPHRPYTVTLDNLFTSRKLLLLLAKLGYGARGTARTNAGMHVDLIKRKRSDINDTIPWGSLDRKVVAEGQITEIGWKDTGGYCLFMSNVVDGEEEVITKRRRPKETAVCAKTGRQPFRNQTVKELPRPKLTWLYNMLMNQVNRGDAIRASYPIQQQQQKGWKAIFFTLLGFITVNSYLVSLHSPVASADKFTCQRLFRQALYKGLFDHSGPNAASTATGIAAGTATDSAAGIAAGTAADLMHSRVKMSREPCVICKQHAAAERRAKKRQKRQGLQEISPNFVSRRKDEHVNRAKSGCDLCKVHLCAERTGRSCWKEYHN